MTTPDHGPSALQVEDGHGGGLVVSGELDLASAPRLASALDRQVASGQQDVVVDLSGLAFCDSSGLSVLVDTHRNLRAVGRRLVLRHPSARVQKLLAATKLDQELTID